MSRLTLPAPARIVKIEQENYRTRTFTLDLRLDACPGQFVMAWLPRFDEKPFSLVDADPVTLMITAVGPFTRLVHELQVGERLWLRGPFGHGFDALPAGQHAVLVGGGYGVAPLLWFARRHLANGNVAALLGARTADDLLYAGRFEQLSDPSAGYGGRCATQVVTEDGSRGDRGLVTGPLTALLQAGKADAILACGPHGMLQAVARLGAAYHVPCQLSWEAYMRCGIGICGACELDGRVLCLDGPVLPVAQANA